MRPARRAIVAAGALALALLGCDRAAPPAGEASCADCALAFDFVASFPLARVQVEPRTIDFGTAGARRHLVDGWSWRAPDDGRPRAVVGGVGRASVLGVWMATSRPATLRFRVKPTRGTGERVRRMGVVANGQTVATVDIEGEMQGYAVDVPAEVWRAGENRLEFRYWPAEATRESERRDRRVRPVMAWDWLRIEGEGRPEAPAQLDAPRLDAARNALVLPAGSRLDYFLDAAPGSVLEVAGVEPADDGPKPAKLAVEIATRETTRRVEVAGAGRIALSGDETGPLRVSFAGASGRGVRVLGATLSSPVKPVPAAAPRPDPHVAMPNIVVFLVDTLRADHLGCYGYPLPTSPRIDAFAAEATLFANFQAQSPWTRPSVASLFTGLTGPAHQANHRNAALSEEAVTLAELLRDAGYQTAAFALNSNIDRKLGLAQGFQVYRIGGGLPLLEEEAMEWLGNRPPNRRFFLYLHHMDPHVPYDPREPYREAFARGVDPERGTLETMQGLVSGQTLLESEAEALALRRDLAALYDAEVASNDERFGRVLDRLRELGLYDDALVLFVADHGEEFFEHGWWAHGKTLHGEQLRVPFIAKFPRGWGAGRRVTALAQQVDVLPTVLDYLGREVPAPVQGRSLLLAVAGHEEEAPPAFAFVDVNGRTAESVVDRSGRWKLIRTTYADRPRPRLALYDLASDPGERRNLAPDEPVVAGWLETLLEVHTRDSAGQLAADPTELDEDIESRLRALGYVGE